MTRKYFGTDGIRGRVGEPPITPDFCLRLGRAAGRVFARNGRRLILIGKDTRVSNYMFESVIEAGLSSAGVDVRLLGPMPTPAVAYLTRTLRADAGIVISASHNPYYDNGIKFFDWDGNKLPDAKELEIEAELDSPLTCVTSEAIGKVKRVEDARGRYIEFCKATVDRGMRLSGFKIVLDCAHGATYDVAPGVFAELGADITVIGADQNGVVLDGDELLFIIARHRAEARRLTGGVVGTLMSNFGMEQALGRLSIPFVRTKVGDRYILEELKKRDWEVGGEGSGHILCLDLNTTGDGIVSALQVLSAMMASGKSLAELRTGMEKYPQSLVNVNAREPGRVVALERVKRAVGEVEHALAGTGRVLLRPSGTEPLVRVMVEGQDASQVVRLADELASVVRAEANGS